MTKKIVFGYARIIAILLDFSAYSFSCCPRDFCWYHANHLDLAMISFFGNACVEAIH
jgi:hypothetical protein